MLAPNGTPIDPPSYFDQELAKIIVVAVRLMGSTSIDQRKQYARFDRFTFRILEKRY
jgi:hypothetical protein